MKNLLITSRSWVLFLIVILFAFSSCKKDEVAPEILKEQAWSSEIYSAMQEIYLWNDALPATFDEKKYTSAQNALDYLIGLKINSETGEPIDRYSFLDKIGSLSGEIVQGTSSGDFGFMVTVGYNSTKQISFFVNYVYKNSPAGKAGIERTYEVTKINGSTDVHPTVDANNHLVPTSAGYVNMTNALFDSSNASFTFKKPNGTTLDVSLTAATYTINSILCDSIYNVGGNKVGYMVFNQFLGASSQTDLTNIISKFESNGVKDLIVDLRYNGGGSVETCEKFADLLVPQSANGKLMYSYKLNSSMMTYYSKNNYNLSTNFVKSNSFQPEKIYFIVSGGTASASELLINNLRPYFNGSLFLIGQTTYGKPCGFWATPIGYTEKQTTTKEGYDLYAVSFVSVNANSEGGYYSGMTPGTTQYPGVMADDSFFFPWGDTNDYCLSQALNHIANGAFIVIKKAPSKMESLQTQRASEIDRQFKGMIDFRKHF